MANHIKPTKEELEANIQKSQAELAALEKDPTPEEEKVTPPAEEEVIEEEEVEEEKEIQTEPTPEEQKEPETEKETVVEEEDKSQPDYKKKFTESSREAQIIAAREKQINSAVDKASELPEPTEEELQAEYSDWDIMDDTARKLARKTMLSERRFNLIAEARNAGRDIEAWNGKVDTFLEDPKTLVDYPHLEGKVEDFKEFSMKPTRRGVDFETLVSAFVGTQSLLKAKKPKTKGQMFEQGSGGPNDKPKPKSDKISIEQGKILRETNYKEYKKLLVAGKIEQPTL